MGNYNQLDQLYYDCFLPILQADEENGKGYNIFTEKEPKGIYPQNQAYVSLAPKLAYT